MNRASLKSHEGRAESSRDTGMENCRYSAGLGQEHQGARCRREWEEEGQGSQGYRLNVS